MIQHQHAASAQVAPCPTCGREPSHIEHFGHGRNELLARNIPTHRHSLECRCGRHTALHAQLADAEAEWGLRQTQIPLALPANVAHIRRGRKLKAVRS